MDLWEKCFKPVGNPLKHFTPFNIGSGKILDVYHPKIILKSRAPKETYVGNDLSKWCKYHRILGDHIDGCHHLKQKIKKLIQECVNATSITCVLYDVKTKIL